MGLLKRIGLTGIFMALAVSSASAVEYSHYMAWTQNIRDFFVPDKPGFYYLQYNFDYSSGDFRDKNGHSTDALSASKTVAGQTTTSREIGYPGGSITVEANINGTGAVSVNGNLDIEYRLAGIAPTFIYVTNQKILGATYAAFVSVPLVYTSLDVKFDGQVSAALNATGTIRLTGPHGNFVERDFGGTFNGVRAFSVQADDSQFNLADILVQPLWLGWSGKHYAASLGYGFYAPTGEYNKGALDNTGLGFWEHQIQAAVAWYPWEHKATAVMVAGTYEINQDKEHASITPGDVFTLNWGVSQYLPLKKDNSLLMELGLSGYSQWQVKDDRGSDATNKNVHDEVHGAGVELSLVSVPSHAALVARYEHEYYAENRFKGDLFNITFVKKF